MRITAIRTRQVDVPLPAPFHPAWAPGRIEDKIRLAYVRIDTDAGVYGIAGHEFYGAEEQCVARIAQYMVGEDPLRIEKHAGTLRYLWPYFGTAVWFVEIALWDILGKVAGLPVYKLLGNCRDAVPAYASTGQNRTPAQRADDARRLRDEGFRAIKLRIHNDTLADDIAQVAAVRTAVGDRMAIMADANQTDVDGAPMPGPHWSYHRALETARALADYNVTWLEEPLPRHAYEQLRRLREASPVPIAGGEVNQGFAELQRLLVEGNYDVLQPDVTLCEGLLRMRALATTAQAMNVELTPHTWGDPLGTVANLHLAAAIPNASYFEFPHDPPAFPADVYQQTLKTPLVVDNGMVQLPQGPGLGVELQDWIFE
ncbi:MAG TPA: mandelate racemase/muconate lactonizing enzyme family protein [bacterium]|jgi:L-alanine-DL-glutamate epimerase-like enolase superfamily enzyme|nr:mandelate racemase/muconate lactonizing enzyme family protein [bacterium]